MLLLALMACQPDKEAASEDTANDSDSDTDCASVSWYVDVDGDGFGAGDPQGQACAAPAGAALTDGDCDDTDRDRHPDAAEACNGEDDDCDTLVDDYDSDVTGTPEVYRDADGDGYGAGAATSGRCEVADGYVTNGEDCDDTDASVSPAAVERCEPFGLDDDCDGLVDGDDPSLDPSEVGTWYADLDGDGYGNPAAPTPSCGPGVGVAEDPSDCDDTDVDVNPDAPEVCSNGVDDDCDGTPGPCGISGDFRLSSMTTTAKIMGESENSQLARNQSMARAGDVNGDGFDDVFVSAPLYNGAAGHSGRAYLFYGPVTGRVSAATADFRIEGTAYVERLGNGMLGDTDLDGDGSIDLVVGGVWPDTGDRAALVFSGPGTGALTNADADIAFYAPGHEDYYAKSLAAGDFDGDGADDLAVGEQEYDGSSTTHLFRGPLAHGAAHVDTADLTAVGTELGKAMVMVDLDGDGTDELVVSGWGGRPSDAGAHVVYVIAGGTMGTVNPRTDADAWLYDGGDATSPISGIGGALAFGDLDNDGSLDLVMGAEYSGEGGVNAGAVYVAFSPVAGEVDATGAGAALYAVSYAAHFGSAVAAQDDLTGDGVADLVVGAYLDDGGTAKLFAGPLTAGTRVADAAATMEAETRTEYAGWAVAAPGDVDGDGWPDLLVGAAYNDGGAPTGGAAYLLSGGGL